MIPRALLFGQPRRWDLQLAPDGGRLAYLGSDDGVIRLGVMSLEVADSRWLAGSARCRVASFRWSTDSRRIIYIEEKDGRPHPEIRVVDSVSGEDRRLTGLGFG